MEVTFVSTLPSGTRTWERNTTSSRSQADLPPREKKLREGGLVMQSGGLGTEMPGSAEDLVRRKALSHREEG